MYRRSYLLWSPVTVEVLVGWREKSPPAAMFRVRCWVPRRVKSSENKAPLSVTTSAYMNICINQRGGWWDVIPCAFPDGNTTFRTLQTLLSAAAGCCDRPWNGCLHFWTRLKLLFLCKAGFILDQFRCKYGFSYVSAKPSRGFLTLVFFLGLPRTVCTLLTLASYCSDLLSDKCGTINILW